MTSSQVLPSSVPIIHPFILRQCYQVFSKFFGLNTLENITARSQSFRHASMNNNRTVDCDQILNLITKSLTKTNQIQSLNPKEALGEQLGASLETTYWIITGLGLLINASVAGGILNARSKLRGTRIYLLNLNLADFLLSLSCGPITYSEFVNDGWPSNWPPITCSLIRGIQLLSIYASVGTIVTIAIERLRALIWPLETHVGPRDYQWFIVIFIWSTGAILSSIHGYMAEIETTAQSATYDSPSPSLMSYTLCREKFITNALANWYIIALIVAFYVVPLIMITVVACGIAIKFTITRRPLMPVTVDRQPTRVSVLITHRP